MNAQKGEAAVTNPLDGELPEAFSVMGDRLNTLHIQSRSNLGSVSLEDSKDQIRSELSSQLQQLTRVTQQLHQHFVARQRAMGDQRRYGIDLEYKLMQAGGNAIALYVKQSRLLNLDLKLNVVVASRSCPGFTGMVYVFGKHFNVF